MDRRTLRWAGWAIIGLLGVGIVILGGRMLLPKEGELGVGGILAITGGFVLIEWAFHRAYDTLHGQADLRRQLQEILSEEGMEVSGGKAEQSVADEHEEQGGQTKSEGAGEAAG